MARLGHSDLDVFPLCLGGNVFGWTADESGSFAVLDAYAAAGGNFVDTADSYAWWQEGNTGGESETMIGRWLAARGNRDDMVIATKVGRHPGNPGLSPGNVRATCEASLSRLGTDRIDLYYAHQDDTDRPLEEVLGTFGDLIREGKVRWIGASNFTAPRLAEALAVAAREGLPGYVALQPEYSLVERAYEEELEPVCAEHGLACLPYYSLANGFLTGKYRPGQPVESARAERAAQYLDRGGAAVLGALDEIAAAHRATVAAVSLAWLLAKPTVAAPIASARTPGQLADLLPAAALQLTAAEVAQLDAVTG